MSDQNPPVDGRCGKPRCDSRATAVFAILLLISVHVVERTRSHDHAPVSAAAKIGRHLQRARAVGRSTSKLAEPKLAERRAVVDAKTAAEAKMTAELEVVRDQIQHAQGSENVGMGVPQNQQTPVPKSSSERDCGPNSHLNSVYCICTPPAICVGKRCSRGLARIAKGVHVDEEVADYSGYKHDSSDDAACMLQPGGDKCPLDSGNRCGLSFNGCSCQDSQTPYCNEADGWCSSIAANITDGHRFNYVPSLLSGMDLFPSNFTGNGCPSDSPVLEFHTTEANHGDVCRVRAGDQTTLHKCIGSCSSHATAPWCSAPNSKAPCRASNLSHALAAHASTFMAHTWPGDGELLSGNRRQVVSAFGTRIESIFPNGRYVFNSTIDAPRQGCKSSPANMEQMLRSHRVSDGCAFLPLENRVRLNFMMEMLATTARLLEKFERRVPPLLAGGTLIGAARSGDLMPWTDDNDLDVSREIIREIQSKKVSAVQKAFFEAGYLLFWEMGCGRVCAHTGHPKITSPGRFGDCVSKTPKKSCVKENGVRQCKMFYFATGITYVDLYDSVLMPGRKVYIGNDRQCQGSTADDYLPPAKLTIRGTEFYVPKRPNTTICKLWGLDWRTPKQSHKAMAPCPKKFPAAAVHAARCKELENGG